jgi:hypothetical protein
LRQDHLAAQVKSDEQNMRSINEGLAVLKKREDELQEAEARGKQTPRRTKLSVKMFRVSVSR